MQCLKKNFKLMKNYFFTVYFSQLKLIWITNHSKMSALLVTIMLVAFSICSSCSYATAHKSDQFDKMVKLRDSIRPAHSLQQFAKKVTAYCALQQQKMAKFYVQSANLSTVTENGCLCANQSCACCADLNLAFRNLRVHEEICLNVTYLAEIVAIQLAVVVDGHAVFNLTVSATNPPPLCLPFIVGELCFELYNLRISDNSFSGCALVELILLHQKVIHEKLGCFRLPVATIPSAFSKHD